MMWNIVLALIIFFIGIPLLVIALSYVFWYVVVLFVLAPEWLRSLGKRLSRWADPVDYKPIIFIYLLLVLLKLLIRT